MRKFFPFFFLDADTPEAHHDSLDADCVWVSMTVFVEGRSCASLSVKPKPREFLEAEAMKNVKRVRLVRIPAGSSLLCGTGQ